MKPSSKYGYIALLVFSGAVSIWLGALCLTKLTVYVQFSHHTPGKATNWKVVSQEENHHQVCVDYQFQVKEKLYTAQYLFLKPSYSNVEAAQYAKEAMEKERIDVWVKLSKGKMPLSIVDRSFPYNELIRFGIALFILLYFGALRWYTQVHSLKFGEESPVGSKKS